MKKFKSKVGLTIYEATADDTKKLGGRGICDWCGNHSKKGFLIAVLNSYYCPECYAKFDSSSKMYEEDLPVEKRHVAYFDTVFGT